MSRANYVLEDSTEMTALANAIRTKTGSNASMSVSDMATAVSGISAGGISYTSVASTNKGSKTQTTIFTLPNALQGGSKDFYFVSIAHSGGSYPTVISVCQYLHSNNTFTKLKGSGNNGYLNTIAWNNSSTKTQVKLTMSSSNCYWGWGSSDTFNDIFIIY